MIEIVRVLNDMMKDGIIKNYAVFGAVAQMRYTEAVVTMDVDILIDLKDHPNSLAVLTPLYEYCHTKGYEPEGEAIRIGEWPAQFIPAYDRLTTDAVNNADESDLDGVAVRVVRADYLAVIALGVGRIKDFMRILALIESKAVSEEEIQVLAQKYDLTDQWSRYRKRFLNGQ